MVVRGSKDEEKLSEIKENFIESNLALSKLDGIPNNGQEFTRDKAFNFIKYGSKALNDNFQPQSIIEEEEEEENNGEGKGEGKGEGNDNKENKDKEEIIEDREFRPASPRKHFIKNSKSYIALRENYTGIQNRIIDLAQKNQILKEKIIEKENENKKENENANENENINSEPITEPIVNIQEEIEEQNKTKELFEKEDQHQEMLPVSANISIRDFKKYHESISTPLTAINESNNKYHQLENTINKAKDKLDQLIEAEEELKTSFGISSDEKLSHVVENEPQNLKSEHNRKKSISSNHSRSNSSSGKKKKKSSNKNKPKSRPSSKHSNHTISSKNHLKSHSRSVSQSYSRNLTKSYTNDESTLLNQDNDYPIGESVIEKEFNELKEQIINGIGEVENAINEFVEWKNEIINNNIPSNMKLEITLLFSRLFRSKNILLTPLFETLRKIDIYSRKWVNKDRALSKIEEDYLRQDLLINIAIRKMLQLNFQVNQLKSKRSMENWYNLLEKFLKKHKLLMYKNYQFNVSDFGSADNISKPIMHNLDRNDKEYYEKKINYLKEKLNKYKEKHHDGASSDEGGKSKKKKKDKEKPTNEKDPVSEDLFLRILDNEKRKISSKHSLFNRTLLKRRPKIIWNKHRQLAVNIVRYKYLVQKSFRALPFLIQNLKDYVTKGFWRGPHLFRNHYISEFNNELYTRTYYKKYTSPDIIPNHNSCTDLKELLKLSTNKVNSNLVRSNSFGCGQEFPWINSRSLNEGEFKEANKRKRVEINKELFEDSNLNNDILDPSNNIEKFISDQMEIHPNLADLTKSQICDIITLLYPDTESIVKIFNEQQPKFYISSDDEYEVMEDMENQVLKNEIKNSTNSKKLLNAINDNKDKESNENDIDNIDWDDDVLQEDIIYDQIKNNINNSEDYIPWRNEIEELHFNPYSTNDTFYEKDLKQKVHEYLNNYNSNTVNGLSYKNRFDVKANLSHKIKGEQGDIDEGLIGGGLGVDFNDKKGELTDYFDPEKTWFSLQDVMELTLLHAQQMELLNEEHDKQIEDLNQQLAIAEENINSHLNDSEDEKLRNLKKIIELQDVIKKQKDEIKNLKEENKYYKDSIIAMEDEMNNKTSSSKNPHGIKRKSIIIDFFNRLEEYNSEKLRHHDRLLQEQVDKYLKDFEYRLSHENRLSKPNPEYEEMLNNWMKSKQSQKLKAEFMPLSPGLLRPQYYKELKIHGIDSPWGGKFHIRQDHQKNKNAINYLNLFEVASKMKIRNNNKNSQNKT
ncbi:hypothetical protein BCR32DRAFT_246753 [Anaeromyces robustus]|uniref:Uncharacterized protein n=1 Tax=Anaeromyces robustus TaxID=1754192 RepID=A0A1Y1X036_9FUNG|nr:hypothetical protein BCR32DRAFT_246753 [Anaeromyces robustus]|eukprot:ORX78958.1 hypothetical protein BCR32DRAFT_246753 [Anaeromyces robustus]